MLGKAASTLNGPRTLAHRRVPMLAVLDYLGMTTTPKVESESGHYDHPWWVQTNLDWTSLD